MTADPRRVEAVFAASLEHRSAAERAAYLDEACAGDPALRQRVEALLTAHQQAGSFLERPVPETAAGESDRPAEPPRVRAAAAEALTTGAGEATTSQPLPGTTVRYF